jgi:hypothetical protein
VHHTTNRFRKCFANLPEDVKKISKKNFELLKTNPLHPSLHFKKVGKYWSVRIGTAHRALAVEDGEDFIWVWIGTHSQYERMIKEHG